MNFDAMRNAFRGENPAFASPIFAVIKRMRYFPSSQEIEV
jgi:hypothetical protein